MAVYRTRTMTIESILDAYSVIGVTGCRIWQRATDEFGYGFLRYKGKLWRVHRLAFVHSGGVLARGECVLHRCDTPACSNPVHLFAGTREVNNEDRRIKGRTSHGEEHHRAHLTEDDVRAIRTAAQTGTTQLALAVQYGVSRRNVRAVIDGITWKHVA